MALILMTYSSPEFAKNATGLLESGRDAGFDKLLALGPDDVRETSFGREHQNILNEKRGGGFWLWKPYLIKKKLLSIKDDDYLFYCDAGRSSYYRFSSRPTNLLHYLSEKRKGMLLAPSYPHLGSLMRWTKRDCLELMEVQEREELSKPTILASWSIWRRTDFALDFLEEWIRFSTDRRCITDDANCMGKPNYSQFQDHRHDQSIMSVLAHKMNAPFVDLSRSNVQNLINKRPNSELGQIFYKRPQNIEDLLGGASPLILLREYLRLRSMR